MCIRDSKIGSHPMTPEEVDALVTEGVLPPTEYDIVAFDFGIKYNIPVSYTHLDVYKRQGMRRAISFLVSASDTRRWFTKSQ